MKLKITIFLFILFFSQRLTPQALIDSLRQKLNNCKTDSCKTNTQLLLLEELYSVNETEYEQLTEKLFLSIPQSDSLNYLTIQLNYALLCIDKNNTNKAFNILSALKLTALKTNSKQYLAKANFGLAQFYKQTNDSKKASTLFFDALNLFEQLKDIKCIVKCYSKIAKINYSLNSYNKAIEFNKKALDIAIKNNYQSDIIGSYIELGRIYYTLNKYDVALEYYNRALRICNKLKHQNELAIILINIGNVFLSKNQLQQSEKYYKEALVISLKNSKNSLISSCYINIGNIAYNQSNFKDAELNYSQALKYIEKNDLTNKEVLYYNLGEVNYSLKNFDKAFQYQDSSITLKDSIFSHENIKSLNDMQTKYETTKTKLELEKKQLEANNKQIIIYAAFGGCILLIGGLFFIVRGLVKQRKANNLLSEKNIIIEEQKHIVEEKNKDIGDSIRYAKRIQEAILPPDKMWYGILPNSFVLYYPKDILSGDFYWLEHTDNYIFVAAADCTGHGVPGALMSIVNYNLLNKAVLEKNLTMPGEILDSVNYYLTHSLHQSYNESSIKDGMDITLLSINKKTNEIYFAGANNPIYIISNGILQEVKADKFPVGAFIEDNIQNFKSQKLNVKTGDTIYLFTDGYADQFGGPKGKKFKYKQFSDLLVENCNKSLLLQQSILQQQFNNWKGNLEQVDDVCVLGIKL